MSDDRPLELTLRLTPDQAQSLLTLAIYVNHTISSADDADENIFAEHIEEITSEIARSINESIGGDIEPDEDGMFDPEQVKR